MHLIMKVKVVNLNLPVCKEESRTEKGLQYCQVRSLSAGSSGFCCMFLARQRRFLLLKLFSVRCGWARRGGGGMCERREGTKGEGRGREGGREDDGTGVEFTHPAGSAHYWHICLGVMSHPSCRGSEGGCGWYTIWNIKERVTVFSFVSKCFISAESEHNKQKAISKKGENKSNLWFLLAFYIFMSN